MRHSVFITRGLRRTYGDGPTAVHALRGIELVVGDGELVSEGRCKAGGGAEFDNHSGLIALVALVGGEAVVANHALFGLGQNGFQSFESRQALGDGLDCHLVSPVWVLM